MTNAITQKNVLSAILSASSTAAAIQSTSSGPKNRIVIAALTGLGTFGLSVAHPIAAPSTSKTTSMIISIALTSS